MIRRYLRHINHKQLLAASIFLWFSLYFFVACVVNHAGRWSLDWNNTHLIQHLTNLVPLRDMVKKIIDVINGINTWGVLRPWLWQTVFGIVSGVLLPAVSGRFKSYALLAATSLAAFTALNAARFFLCIGFFDVTDILLNFVGASVGYLLYLLLSRRGAVK